MLYKVFKLEFKNMVKDKLYIFFIIYPFMIGMIAYFLMPYLKEVSMLALDILALVLVLISPVVYGALSGFSLLDDRDDNILISLRVSPIRLSYYIVVKLIISYFFATFVTVLLMVVLQPFQTTFLHFILVALLSSLQGPIVALLINAFSNNKVEGFVIMKATGILLLVPISVLFINHSTELLLGIIPGFWVSRIVSMMLLDNAYIMPMYGYYGLGFLANGVMIYVLFKLFIRRIKN